MGNSIITTQSFGDGKAFSVISGDITLEKVECIVSPSNRMMKHSGGLAAIIDNKAGHEFVAECRNYIEFRGPLDTCESVVLSGGRLPFRAIINVNSPSANDENVGFKIEQSLFSIFEKAHKLNFKSISFSAISSGINGVPYDICAKSYFMAVANFYSHYSDTALRNIRICVKNNSQLIQRITYFAENYRANPFYNEDKSQSAASELVFDNDSVDVFISFKYKTQNGSKTDDSILAMNLYEYLKSKGVKVFFSNNTLLESGASEYKEQIDEALSEAKILVVVGTKQEHLDSGWVKYEWNSFSIALLGGYKEGQVFCYTNGLKPSDLPWGLRSYQCIRHEDQGMHILHSYIANALKTFSAILR